MMQRRTCVAALAAACSPISWAEPAAIGAVVDWPAVTLLSGQTLAPASWREQPAIVVIWATWCPFCIRHNAHLDKLARSSQGQSLRILGIALDTDAQLVRQYMAGRNFQFPVALDGGVLRQRLTARRVTPMTCLLDRQGRLVQAIPGEMFEDDVLELAPRLLARSG